MPVSSVGDSVEGLSYTCDLLSASFMGGKAKFE